MQGVCITRSGDKGCPANSNATCSAWLHVFWQLRLFTLAAQLLDTISHRKRSQVAQRFTILFSIVTKAKCNALIQIVDINANITLK